jgi:hypothetical protein
MRPAALIVLLGVGAAVAGCGVVSSGELNDAQLAIADMRLGTSAQPSDLTITANADRPSLHYRAGERIGLSFQVSKPASVAVLRVRRNGMTTIVFPNKAQPDAQVAANTVVQITAPVTAEKGGPELFKFIAATGSGSWLFGRKPEEGADFADLGPTTRALARGIGISFQGGRGGDLATTQLVVTVSD